jgi:GNAT superfamily N-acetyltransferase
MFEKIRFAFCLFRESLAENKLSDLFRQQIFRHRIATPAMMDLTKIQLENNKSNTEYRFIELRMNELNSNKWSFAMPSRRIKAGHNLKRGLRGFAVVQGSLVLGDVWCAVPNSKDKSVIHPDLKMLGIECKEDEAYGMDMLITPEYRGKNLAAPLQRFLQTTLRVEGYKKMYGYYWNDNIPAMWMHRMLQFKELPKRRISRFFSFIKTEAHDPKISQ